MKSKIPDDLLSAFLDHEVTPAEEAAVNAQLQTSPEAKQELRDYQRLSELLHALPQQTLPSEFASAVMQRAERETLIPLDAAGIVDCDSHLQRPSRRAWFLTAIAAVAASVAVLFIAIPGKNRPATVLALKEAPAPPPQGNSAVDFFAAQAPPSKAGKSVARFSGGEAAKPAEASVGRPAQTIATLGRQGGGVSTFAMHHQSAESKSRRLVFPADLKTAQMGDVIEAMESVGDQVAVVRLTVVNQTSGLGGLQSLLVRDSSRQVQGKEKARLIRERFADKKGAVAIDRQITPSATGDLVCVFVEGSREQLADVLKDVQNESQIQKAQLTNTISAAKLAQYANRPVAQSGQTGTHSAPPAQTILSLPAATVDKIVADREPVPSQKAAAGANKAATPALVYNSLSLDRDSQSKAAVAPAAAQPSQNAAPEPIAATQGRPLPAGGRQAGGRQIVAAAQRSYQLFFVLDDQSVARSVSAVQPPAAPDAQSTPEPQPSVRPRRPVPARRPVKQRAPVSAERPD